MAKRKRAEEKNKTRILKKNIMTLKATKVKQSVKRIRGNVQLITR